MDLVEVEPAAIDSIVVVEQVAVVEELIVGKVIVVEDLSVDILSCMDPTRRKRIHPL